VQRNGHTPPLALTVCVIQSTGTCTAQAQYLHRHKVAWNPPNVGVVAQYRIYRALGDGVNASSAVELVCGVPGNNDCPTGSSTTFVDKEELPYNQWFTYFVRAVFDKCDPVDQKCESAASNFVKVFTENTAPTVVNDQPPGQVYVTPLNTPLTVPKATGVVTNDSDPDSPPKADRIKVFVTVPPQFGMVVLNPDGSFVYTPTVVGYFGPDEFKYKANNGKWRPGTPLEKDMSAVSSTEATVKITIDKKKK
jgi:hypothetical protein